MEVTFLGHAGFIVRGDTVTIVVDPFLTGNPRAVHDAKDVDCDVIVLTHGHADHFGDSVAIAKRTGATVVAPFETGNLLEEEGIQSVEKGNPGGKIGFPFGSISFTTAIHSSSYKGRYAGVACGVVIALEDRTFYHTGDTDIFSDMKLIGEIYRPDIAAIPIGDRFTMGPELAARAAELIGAPKVIPIHYKTFPALVQTTENFRPRGISVLELEPGTSVTI